MPVMMRAGLQEGPDGGYVHIYELFEVNEEDQKKGEGTATLLGMSTNPLAATILAKAESIVGSLDALARAASVLNPEVIQAVLTDPAKARGYIPQFTQLAQAVGQAATIYGELMTASTRLKEQTEKMAKEKLRKPGLAVVQNGEIRG